jgi:sulfide dehydrogenase cytochrome subunit
MHVKALKYLFMALTGLVALSPPTIWADVPPLVVAPCISCHGPGGSSVGPATPSIAGMDNEVFVEMMEEYKEGGGSPTIMGRIAKGYSADDFNVMANYFTNQRRVNHPQVWEADKANRGAKRHKKYCEKCHEENGRESESSILAGQWMPYLQFSLADFKSGKREMGKKMKKRLKKMVRKYGEDSLDDIVHFYGSQK